MENIRKMIFIVEPQVFCRIIILRQRQESEIKRKLKYGKN